MASIFFFLTVVDLSCIFTKNLKTHYDGFGNEWGTVLEEVQIPSLFPNARFKIKCIKKMWYIYTMEYYSAVKRKERTAFLATWMDLEIIMLSEVK